MRSLAFDRASVRSVDADGRLHIAVNNISKSSVDPYYGREIPGYQQLGLNPDKVYHLLRDPEELEKAAPTFNNLPILAEHIPVSANEHMPEIVIGSTGTDAEFVAPFLRNSAVVWAREAIDHIESEQKRDWSCAYRYTPDMTPGTFKGLRYDGVMRDIQGNHVALVEQGRAGPEVVVGDSLFTGGVMLKSKRAILLHGALIAGLAPKLAAGSKVDFAGALDSVTATNITAKASKLAADIVKLATPHLAADAGLDVSDVTAIIGAIQGAAGDVPAADDDLNPMDDTDEMPATDADGDAMARVMAFLKGKLSDEDLAECGKLSSAPAMDADGDDDEDDDKDKPAMDAVSIRRATLREMADIRDAERAVEPHVGRLAVAMDSAADVYRFALDAAGIDLKGVHPSAFKSMVAMLAIPGAAPAPRVAMDASATGDFKARYPDAVTLIRS